ncbi:hypothetical protein HHK36_007289 [Tetracentron sinense]|uniref:S-acyltransferase n=1 Tax=Tetracentron sinense TaxID=13715 RepID=A0A834ZKP7_TETSI|nr:hypothetical protein HHK36_007289 [Tetracentron sinense]
MRKHGWQLPYHPLQVVAVAVFLALGFAFYVFFVPFVGRKLFQYIVMGLYTPLVATTNGPSSCVIQGRLWIEEGVLAGIEVEVERVVTSVPSPARDLSDLDALSGLEPVREASLAAAQVCSEAARESIVDARGSNGPGRDAKEHGSPHPGAKATLNSQRDEDLPENRDIPAVPLRGTPKPSLLEIPPLHLTQGKRVDLEISLCSFYETIVSISSVHGDLILQFNEEGIVGTNLEMGDRDVNETPPRPKSVSPAHSSQNGQGGQGSSSQATQNQLPEQTDPADTGVSKSNKYPYIVDNGKCSQTKESTLGGESTSSIHDTNTATVGKKPLDEGVVGMDAIGEDSTSEIEKNASSQRSFCCMVLLGLCPCAFICNCSNPNEQSLEQQMSEDGMFYCSLCEVEVFKYSKHCRVCDKCVDHFDHHCRWLNNCIGKKNYRQFFILMVSALLLVYTCFVHLGLEIAAYSTVVDRSPYNDMLFSRAEEILCGDHLQVGEQFLFGALCCGGASDYTKLASCTILAMIATLPLTQLFFFHVLLIKKGISTYDYIIALREQEQQCVGGQQSPQMSPASSLTGLSSASSFSTFHRGAWCTPPRLFLEDQFDVVPPDTGMSVSSLGKGMVGEEPIRKKNPGAVKISPWTLARLNAEEVSKVAAQARKKSRILQPVVRRDMPLGLETDSSFGSSSGRMVPRPDNRRRANKRVRLPVDLPIEPLTKISAKAGNSNGVVAETSTSLAPLQLEARSAFRTSRGMSASASIVASSPESSLDSPDLHPFRVSSLGTEEARRLTTLTAAGSASQKGIPLSRSTSDGYEASGGEDSDRVPSRTIHRSTNWNNIFSSGHQEERVVKSKPSFSSSLANNRKL